MALLFSFFFFFFKLLNDLNVGQVFLSCKLLSPGLFEPGYPVTHREGPEPNREEQDKVSIYFSLDNNHLGSSMIWCKGGLIFFFFLLTYLT